MVFSVGADGVAPDILFNATFAASLDGNYSKASGSLTATTSGVVVNTSGQADLSTDPSFFKKLQFDAVNNFPHGNIGACRFNAIPNYTGTPTTRQWYFLSSNSGNTQDQIFAEHHTDGVMYYYVYNTTSGNIVATSFAWAPTLGQTYAFYFHWDTTNGNTKFFIDTVQKATSAATGTKGSTTDYFKFGADEANTSTDFANFKIDELTLYNAIQTP